LQNQELAAKERRDLKEIGWFKLFCALCVRLRLTLQSPPEFRISDCIATCTIDYESAYMVAWFPSRFVLRTIGVVFALYVLLVAFVFFRQRSMIFFPSHETPSTMLSAWSENGRVIGYCREAPNARTIWLMTHGNAGQAADRDYVLGCLSEQDSLYVLEYPGYGSRAGTPSRQSMNQAASEAYLCLRLKHPGKPVCVLGESIGSGPACALGLEKDPPDKIVLVVPFDTLANVAARHFPFLPVRLMLRDRWNNVEVLRHYTGPVQIFAAVDDAIIPIEHAKALARQVPKAQLIPISGGHNDWANDHKLQLSFP